MKVLNCVLGTMIAAEKFLQERASLKHSVQGVHLSILAMRTLVQRVRFAWGAMDLVSRAQAGYSQYSQRVSAERRARG